jgi:ketosteroid isomerase-like protein
VEVSLRVRFDRLLKHQNILSGARSAWLTNLTGSESRIVISFREGRRANRQCRRRAQGYEAFGRGDIDGLLAQLDPDLTSRTPGPAELPTAGDRRGHAGVREFFQTLLGIMAVLRFELKQFIPSGDLVLVIGDDTARVKATGTTLETRFVHAFTVRDGKVVASRNTSISRPCSWISARPEPRESAESIRNRGACGRTAIENPRRRHHVRPAWCLRSDRVPACENGPHDPEAV